MKRCPRCKQIYGDELQHCPDDGTPLVDRIPGHDRFMGRILAGRYEVLDLLGRGGFGTVFKVRDRKMEDVIALKVFERGRFSDREAQEAMGRFRREGVILRRTGKRSRHIVTVYDFEEDEAEDLFYFTMDFVDGITLSKVLATEGPLSVHRTLHLARQICDALGAAHQEGVVHRDLKLENLMVVQEGGEEVVKVLDFGIAKVMGSGSLTNLAMGVPGTPGYASPEQLQAPSSVDPRTDLFALGVVLYGLLSGREPWSNTSIAEPTSSDGVWELIRSSMEKDPFPLRKWNPDVPKRLEAAIVRLLSKRQDDRFQSAAELDRELAAIQEHVRAEGTGASAKGGARRAGIPARRTLLLVGTAALLILVAFFTLPRFNRSPGVMSPEGLAEEIGRGTVVRAEVADGALSGVRMGRVGREEPFSVDLRGVELQELARRLRGSGIPLISPGRAGVRITLEGGAGASVAGSALELEGEWGGCSPCVWGGEEELAGGWYTVRVQGPEGAFLSVSDPEGVYPPASLSEDGGFFLPAGTVLELMARLPSELEDEEVVAEVIAEDAVGPGPGDRVPEPRGVLDTGAGNVVPARTAPEIAARAATPPEPPALRVLDLDVETYLFSDGQFTVEGSFRVAGPSGVELCIASLFAQADQGPLQDHDGEFALAGMVAVVDPPLSSDPAPRGVSFSHRLPAAQLDLGRGTVQVAASTHIWAGSCVSVDPASPPLARASTEPLCVTRLAAGWYPCRGGS